MQVAGATEVLSPSRALTEAGDEAALIVLGSRGYGRVAGALLGSVAFAVAARARCPVVVVKDEAVDRPPGGDRPIVVGADGSPASVPALDFAAEHADATGAPLDVLTCTGTDLEDVEGTELWASAERIARAAADRARSNRPGLDVTSRVEACSADAGLVRASPQAGLVVVGTRGRGAYEGMLLGSASHAVIHGAECAVAVV